MPSITDWTRLEPRTRDEEMGDGLAARVHDPLWLLTRQWQLGEYLGEDAGSPVSVRVQLAPAPLTRFHAGPMPQGGAVGRPFDHRRQPLEALIEREQTTVQADGAARRFAVDAGQHFLRLLQQHGLNRYCQAYLTHYGLPEPNETPTSGLDAAALRFLRLMARRVPDGLDLRTDLEAALHPAGGGAGELPDQPPIADADRADVTEVAEAYLAWCRAFFSEPEDEPVPAWVDERMEYAFAVGGRSIDGEEVLNAAEYTDGTLDWYTFDRLAGGSIGAVADPPSSILIRTGIPSPVTYRGMPSPRWWELEDAQVNFGLVQAGPEDLARLLLLEFALVYANDWFAVPVTLPVGQSYRTRSLVVTDTFGERRLLRSYAEVDGPAAPWRLFHLSGSVDPALLLTPTTSTRLESPPVEEVLFLRDEMANLAWAVERRIAGPHGRAVDRHEVETARRSATTPATEPAIAPVAYRLATQVPVHWIPLIPVHDAASEPRRLRRALLLQGGPAGLMEPEPLGRILLPGQSLNLHEEEVPRTGARVTRCFQSARTSDGTIHLWLGRSKGPGRGEGFSGLRFDVVEDTGQTEAASGRGAFDLSRFEEGDRFSGE